jgi:hypothetical protein
MIGWHSVGAVGAAAIPEALFCGEVVARRPRARPFRARLRINELSAEVLAELFCVAAPSKAEHDHVCVVAAE